MNEILKKAEQEMQELRQPYLGSHHYFLAYLKDNKNSVISYNYFKKIIIKTIGSCQKKHEKILYTPYMRKISKSNMTTIESVKTIIIDENSITHNLLLNEKINIEKLLKEL